MIPSCDRSRITQTIPDLTFASLFINDLEGQYVGLNGVRIYYETFGRGEPVVLLHSGFAFIESFYKQIPELSKSHYVIAPDRRGHGRSSDSSTPYDCKTLAADTHALLQHLGVSRAAIIGWADGGGIGLQLALDHPEMVSKLILIESSFHPSGLSDDAVSYAKNKGHDDWDAEAMKWYRRLSPHPGNWTSFRDRVKRMWLTEPALTQKDLAKISVPSLVVAVEDGMIRAEHTRTLVNSLPNAALKLIPGTSHFAPVEKPKEFNAIVSRFLSS